MAPEIRHGAPSLGVLIICSAKANHWAKEISHVQF